VRATWGKDGGSVRSRTHGGSWCVCGYEKSMVVVLGCGGDCGRCARLPLSRGEGDKEGKEWRARVRGEVATRLS
jgi:hypothetical protein